MHLQSVPRITAVIVKFARRVYLCASQFATGCPCHVPALSSLPAFCSAAYGADLPLDFHPCHWSGRRVARVERRQEALLKISGQPRMVLPWREETFHRSAGHGSPSPLALRPRSRHGEGASTSLMFSLELALLKGSKRFDALKKQLLEIASALEDQTALPGIAADRGNPVVWRGDAPADRVHRHGRRTSHDKGAMALLHEPPFTDIGPAGPEQLFDEGRVVQLVGTIRAINDSAVA